jgi:hypothetical protein
MWREKREARNGKGEGKGGEVKKIWKFQLGSAAAFAARSNLSTDSHTAHATWNPRPGSLALRGTTVSPAGLPSTACLPSMDAAFLADGKMKALQGITLTPQFLNMYSSVYCVRDFKVRLHPTGIIQDIGTQLALWEKL